jgi:hypothetical protein
VLLSKVENQMLMSKRLKSGVKLEQAKLCVVKVFYRSDCFCECLGLRATVMLWWRLVALWSRIPLVWLALMALCPSDVGLG